MEARRETVFTWGGPPLKFGAGALDEIGHDVGRLGDVRRVLVVTDRGVTQTGVPDRVVEALAAYRVEATVYHGVHVEPTDASLRAAVDEVGDDDWDAVVAVGGGSSIDTAKALSLLATYPGDVLEYVNAPIGAGRAPPGPVRPIVAVPTTAGTGSESTAVCVLDLLGLRVKSGISHWRLQPSLAIVDPTTTLTMPPMVTAACGMDVVCHALESYTARPYDAYTRRRPEERVAYCGANPIADVWCERALTLVGTALRRAVADGTDLQARTDMMLAATMAGLGFGNAGVHLPHACAYPVAGQVQRYHPPDYPSDHAMVPHGIAVCVTAPAAFDWTHGSDPQRHVRAAELLTGRADPPRLAAAVRDLMRDIGVPSGLTALGYDASHVPALVDGALQQERLLRIAPSTPGADDLAGILHASMANW